MPKLRRFALLLGVLALGALGGWLVYGALNPQWGAATTETFIVERARASEWNRDTGTSWQRLTRDNAPGWYASFAEPVQTLEKYRRQNPTRPTDVRRTLVLLPLGTFNAAETRQLEELRQFCGAFFALPTRLEKPLPLQSWPIPTRAARGVHGSQFDAAAILSQLKPRLPADAMAYLAITNRDLWRGDLNFVFGAASFRERVGVYSLARYQTKGAPANAQLRRACQVLAHETGHMFGISHCVFYRCAMNGSNSLADADGAPLDFCPACTRKLSWNIGYDQAARGAALDAYYRQHFPPAWVRSLQLEDNNKAARELRARRAARSLS